MPANTISQVTTANTFDQWRIQTNSLITSANELRNNTYYKDEGSLIVANGAVQVSNGVLQIDKTSGVTLSVVSAAQIGGQLSTNTIVNSSDFTVQGGSVSFSNSSVRVQSANSVESKNVISNTQITAANIAANGYINLTGVNTTGAPTIGALGGAPIVNVANNTLISNTGNAIFKNTVTLTQSTGNALFVSGNTYSGNLRVGANIVAGNLSVSGTFDAGELAAANLTVTQNISSGNIAATQNISSGNVSVTQNISSGNISVTRNVSTGNLSVTTAASLGTVSATTANVTTLNVATAGGLANIANANIANIASTNATIGTLSVTSRANITTLNVAASGGLANIANANIANIASTNASIGTLSVTTRANAVSANIITANIGTLNVAAAGGLAFFNQITAANSSTTNSISTELSATTANISTLTVTSLTVTNPISGPTESDSDSYRLRVSQATRGDGYFGVNQGGANGNAYLRFTSASNVWQLTANSIEGTYRTVLTTGNITDSLTTVSSVNVASATAVRLAYDQGTSGRDQANTARDQANTARDQANTAYNQANAAYSAANSSSNSTRVFANSGSVQSNVSLNFVNTATVGITVTAGSAGNANISFTTLAGGGTITQVDTGLGLTGGPITTSGTISANVASTTVQGVTKLVNATNSTDAANAATAAAVKTSYDQATSGRDQANTAYTQANTARDQANTAYTQANTARDQANTARDTGNSAYGQANTAYNQANTVYAAANTSGNTVRVSANGGSTLSNKQLNFINTSSVSVSVTSNPDGNANIAFTSTATVAGSDKQIQFNDGGSSGASANLTFDKAAGNVFTVGSGTIALKANATSGAVNAITLNVDTVAVVTRANATSANLVTANIATLNVNAPSSQANIANANIANVAAANIVGGVANITTAGITTLYVTSLTVSNPISGPTESDSDSYRLRVSQTTRGDGYFGVNQGGANGNAYLRFTSASNVWQLTSNSIEGTYRTVLTTGNISDSISTTSSVNAASLTAVKSAYDQATSGRDQANTARDQANTAYTQANTARNQANTAYDQANTARNQANTAYGQANSAYGQANAAYSSSNASGNLVAVYANNTLGMANANLNFNNTATVSVSVSANATNKAANIAFSVITTGADFASGANATAQSAYTQANTARDTGNSAYLQANTARNQANTAYDQANTARDQANTAYGQANAAYGKANSSANSVWVYANGTSVLSAANLNFNNTATVNVSATANGTGQVNVAFTANLSSSVGGSNTHVQFNNNGQPGGSANLTFNVATNVVSVGSNTNLYSNGLVTTTNVTVGNVKVSGASGAANLHSIGSSIFGGRANLASATYTAELNVALASANVITIETGLAGIAFRPSGDKMYVIGTTADKVIEYDLSTPWSIAGAYEVSNLSVSSTTSPSEGAPNDLAFSPDGSMLFVLGTGVDTIFKYNLSTPWQVNTATISSEKFDLFSYIGLTTPRGFTFKDDGKTLLIYDGLVAENTRHAFIASLSEAWNVNTTIIKSNTFANTAVSIGDDTINIPNHLFETGDIVYYRASGTTSIGGITANTVNYYVNKINSTHIALTTSRFATSNVDLTAIGNGTTEKIFNAIYMQDSTPNGGQFSADGTKLFITGASQSNLHSFSMNPPWDINSITHDGNALSLDITPYDTQLNGVYVKPDLEKIYVACAGTERVLEFDLIQANTNYQALTGEVTLGGDVFVKQNLTVDGKLKFDGELDYLRITNNGYGNSFVVLDNSSTDSTPFVIDANGNVGIGVTSVSNAKLYVKDIVDNGATGEYGIIGEIRTQVTSASISKYAIGAFNYVDSWGTSTGAAVGSFGYVSAKTTMAAGNMRAFSTGGDVTISGGGSVPTFVGYWSSNPTVSAGNTITQLYGFYAPDLTSGDTNYSYYSGSLVGAGKWNFYGGGTANNYFAGSVGIGSNAELDTYKLKVTGDTFLNGNVKLDTGTTIRDWNASDTDIDGLLPGSVNGSLIEGQSSAHTVIGIPGNDSSDGFYVIDKLNDSAGTYKQVLLGVSNTAFEYKNSNTSRFYIGSTGNVGIGITSPTSNLHVSGNANITSSLFVSGVNVTQTIANSGNLVAVYANNTLGMANANINFNNTSTVTVAVTANATNKAANVEFNVNLVSVSTALAIPAVNSAIAAANSAIAAANGAASVSNTNMTAANSAAAVSNTNMTAANGALSVTNATMGVINTTFGTVNTNISGANTYSSGLANASGNLVAVYANNTLAMANANINFNNTSTITVSVTANATNKRANIAFSVNSASLVDTSSTNQTKDGTLTISTTNSNSQIGLAQVYLQSNLANVVTNAVAELAAVGTSGYSALNLNGSNGGYIDFRVNPTLSNYSYRMLAQSSGFNIYAGSPVAAANVLNIVSGNVNIDNGTLFVDYVSHEVGISNTNPAHNLAVSGTAYVSSNLTVGGPTVISTQGPNDVLRLTQGGSAIGNVFVVEDETTDNTPFVIDATGKVKIGANVQSTSNAKMTTTTIYGVQANAKVWLAGTVVQDAAFVIGLYESTASTAKAGLTIQRSRGYSNGTLGALGTTDVIGAIDFSGDTGSNVNVGSAIVSVVDGVALGANYIPAKLEFRTADSASVTPDVRMTIKSTGNVGIGNTAPVHTLSVTGNAYVSSNLTVGGNTVLSGNLSSTSNTVLSGTIYDTPILSISAATTYADNGAGKVVVVDSASAVTVTLAPAARAGFSITFIRKNSGNVTIANTSTITRLNTSNFLTSNISTRYGSATAVYTATNEFILFGDIL